MPILHSPLTFDAAAAFPPIHHSAVQVSFKPGRGVVLRYISEAEAAEFVIPPFEVCTADAHASTPVVDDGVCD